MSLKEYIELWAGRQFSWKDDHCVAFTVGWASACDPEHGVEFDKWVEANPAFLKIDSKESAQAFMASIGITDTQTFATRLADATGMVPVDGHITRPGLVVVRDGLKTGLIAPDYRALFLNDGGGLRYDGGRHSGDVFLRPRGLR